MPFTVLFRPTERRPAVWFIGSAALALALAGCGGANTVCQTSAECDDGNVCTSDSCSAEHRCQHDPVSVDDGNVCTTDSCDPASGPMHTAAAVDDHDVCTTDSCDPVGGVRHQAVSVDDGDLCTADSCDRVKGPQHVAVVVDDQNPCTVDRCDSAKGIEHVEVDVSDNDACTVDTCDRATGAIAHAPVDVNDGDECTTDRCDAATGATTHAPVDPDDADVCTIDACDPQAGVSHVVRADLDDHDPCTTDLCDPVTGPVHGSAVDDHNVCTTDSCDASGVKHVAIATDDGNACTTDSCDPVTGVKHVAVNVDDSSVCTTDSCDPVTGVKHIAVSVDDSNACTTDSCDPVTGVKHVAVSVDDGNVCTTDSCDAVTGVKHVAVSVDDGNVCTADSCDPVTGVKHVAVSVDDSNACTTDSCDPVTGVKHVAVNVDDSNVCTTDSCDPVTGVKHVAVNVDDSNACTTDSCDPGSGVKHVAVNVDDGNVCTTDSCDPVTGVKHVTIAPVDDGIACTDDTCDPQTGMTHTPVHSRCDSDGKSCTVATCSPTVGCSEAPTNALCDDGISCNQHLCLGASGDSAGCAPKTPIDGNCGALQVCRATGCSAQTPGDQLGAIIVSEFSALGGEVVELRNTTSATVDVHGWRLKNGSNVSVDLRAPTDLSGTSGTAVLIAPGSQLYGVKNPAVGPAPAGAGFVFGAPGTTFSLSDSGDSLSLYSAGGAKLEDTVNFAQFVTDPNTAVTASAFVGSSAATTQLDPLSLTALANDSAGAWCVTFAPAGATKRRVADTLGTANGSCSAVVLNELYLQTTTTDDGNTFVELAGPGGANVAGLQIVDLNSNGTRVVDGDLGAAEVDGIVTLPAGLRMPTDGYLIVADGVNSGANGFTAPLVPNFTAGVDVAFRDVDLANGPGAVQLLSAGGASLDVVGHDPTQSPLLATTAYNGLAMTEGTVAKSPSPGQSLARGADSTDTNSNSADFHSLGVTPGKLNKILGASISVHLTLGVPDSAITSETSPNAYLSVKPQYVISYNGSRKNPNYNSYEMNSSWKGFVARQDTFRSDDTLPGSIPQAALSDYSSSGWTRGHMCASDDRDATVVDNSSTFYLTNMVPQSANNNSGPWQKLEAYVQCLAVAQGLEVFVVAGGLYEGAPRYTKAGSTVQVPSHTWKVVTVLGAPGQGAGDVTTSTRSFAVIMANDDALISPSAPWRDFRVSVREVESRTGYDFNADVGPGIQDVIESPVDAIATTCTCPSGLSCVAGTY